MGPTFAVNEKRERCMRVCSSAPVLHSFVVEFAPGAQASQDATGGARRTESGCTKQNTASYWAGKRTWNVSAPETALALRMYLHAIAGYPRVSPNI